MNLLLIWFLKLLLLFIICVTDSNSSSFSIWSASSHRFYWHMVKSITLVIIATLFWKIVMQNSCLLNSKYPISYSTTRLVSPFDNIWLVILITGINLHSGKHIWSVLLDVILSHIILNTFLLNKHVYRLLPIWLPPKKDVNWVHTKLYQGIWILQTLNLVQAGLINFLSSFTSSQQLSKCLVSLPVWRLFSILRHIFLRNRNSK